MSTEAVTAIRESLPPQTDYLTYLTILESQLSPAILPTLNDILQDPILTQNIGWDLIQLLIPLPGAQPCLKTIARLGNPREVVLKVIEALRLLNAEEAILDDEVEVEVEVEVDRPPATHTDGSSNSNPSSSDPNPSAEPKEVDKFCTLVSLLATLHPRIKTRYPSRFLSTSLIAILSAYRPSDKATLAIIALLHSLSGKKRPPLPQRKSSRSASAHIDPRSDASAPDPEATAEDPQEGAIQKKLLQSFVTHVLQVYIGATGLEWTVRLQEHFSPEKMVPGRKSSGEAFREDPVLIDRDMVVGQLVAVARDVGLSSCEVLFDAIYAEPKQSEEDDDIEHPSSPDDIPLSRVGSLFLVTCFVFSSVIFDSSVSLPPLSIFPGHAKLVSRFIGVNGPANIGTEEASVIDSIVATGLWLERSDKFVSGPLEDEDFFQYLQTLSLISANTPSPALRYGTHVLLSSILHAHPVDGTRLRFIVDTLENCPNEALKGSAVSWLKEELITARERKSENLFSSAAALTLAQPYLFPDMIALAKVDDAEALEGCREAFPFHMAVLNFLCFVSGDAYAHVVPPAMRIVAEDIYLGPLKAALGRVKAALAPDGVVHKGLGQGDAGTALSEVELLGQRLEMCME